jgi:hypothetical protein
MQSQADFAAPPQAAVHATAQAAITGGVPTVHTPVQKAPQLTVPTAPTAMHASHPIQQAATETGSTGVDVYARSEVFQLVMQLLQLNAPSPLPPAQLPPT